MTINYDLYGICSVCKQNKEIVSQDPFTNFQRCKDCCEKESYETYKKQVIKLQQLKNPSKRAIATIEEMKAFIIKYEKENNKQ